MKHGIKYGGFLLLLLIVIGSCKRTKDEQKDSTICKEDTAEVIRLTTTYLEYLKNKEFDKALQMLHHIQNDTVTTSTDIQLEQLKSQYQTFPVLSYEIDGYYFNDHHHTEVIYSIEFFEKQKGDNILNTLKFRLNPQKIKNVWYLSLLNR